MQYIAKPAMRASAARAPTTPPAIAPALLCEESSEDAALLSLWPSFDDEAVDVDFDDFPVEDAEDPFDEAVATVEAATSPGTAETPFFEHEPRLRLTV